MKKRIFTLMLIFAMSVSMIACGSNDTPATTQDTPKAESTNTTTSTRPASPYDNSTLKSIITGIETDFSDSISYLQTKFDETNTAIGETYEDYIENKQLLADWYNLVLAEENALFERTKERAIGYFKLISSSIDHEDDDAIDNAMDEFYDKIYDDLMDDFYDDIYDDLMDDVYDVYYDGIVDDGYEVDPYEKWSKESSACYKAWSDTSSAVYKGWSDTSSTLYQYWSAVSSGFYKDNFDIDAIIEEYEKEKAEADAKAAEETNTKEENKPKDSSSDNSDGIRPEFKKAMDDYEAFFDEYIEFMNEYAAADTDDLLDMMDDYTDYMEQYVETMKEFQELESEDLSPEEVLYYAEVANRISAKLLEIK